LLFSDDTHAVDTYAPGRMAPNTALGFLILSSALLLLSAKKNTIVLISQMLALFILLLSILPILGYAYKIKSLFGYELYTSMALHTAILFLLASFSLLLFRSEHGLLSIFSSKGIGAYFARRLIPIAIFIPVVLIWLRIMIDTRTFPFLPSELSYFFVLLIIVFVWFVWRIAFSLNIMDAERIQTEVEKQHWINLMNYIIKHDPNAIIVLDSRLHFIYASDRFLSDYDLRDKNIIGKHFYDVFPEIPERWREAHRRALKGEVMRSDDDFFVRANGSVDYTCWECRPWYNNDGSIGGIIIYTEALTALKAAQIQLQKTSDQLELILEHAGDGIIASNQKGMIVMVNKAALEMLGYNKEDLIDKNMHEIHQHISDDGSNYPTENCNIFKSYAEGLWASIDDETFLRKDGSSFPVEYISAPIFEYDKITGAVISFRDISDRKKAEQEIKLLNEELEQKIEQRTQQIQLVNKELEAFTYSVSHDLRAPLRAIDGFTRILQEDYQDHLDDDGKRIMTVIRDNTHNMRQLIDDLLAFSRLSRMDVQRSEIDMNTLVKSVYFELTTEEERNRVEFRVSQLPRAYGDPTMIRQVWVNLLSNALKFSEPKKRPEISISSTKINKVLSYTIRDNGVGFDMRYVDKIFGVFQRLHSVREFDGTGVGLAIVHRIIERHGGTVSAESKLEEYAVFNFSLPTHSTKKIFLSYICNKTCMEDLNPVDILIVEDNPNDAELTIRALKKQNLANKFYQVEDGAEALDFIFCRGQYEQRQFCKPLKVIFLDLKLPKVSGLEVLREIKNNPKTKKLPVVIVTSSKEDPDIKTAYELGANSYVVKPVDFDGFINALSNTGLFWLLVNESPA
jgi:PAS domain S-box-containing protein